MDKICCFGLVFAFCSSNTKAASCSAAFQTWSRFIHISACSTGVVTPLHRRQQIYAVCQKHDIVILEDDPYFYLQFSASSMAPRGLHNLGASYLSLDTDGRVIRLDSFSKVQLSSMCVSCQVLVWQAVCSSLPACPCKQNTS